jgi:hypothetical protein
MKCILGWDVTKKTTKGKGILGTVVAFSAADKGARQENPSLPLANMGQRNKPNGTKIVCFVKTLL